MSATYATIEQRRALANAMEQYMATVPAMGHEADQQSKLMQAGSQLVSPWCTVDLSGSMCLLFCSYQ